MGFWENVEGALVTWMTAFTGIPATQINHAESNSRRPATPYLQWRWINGTHKIGWKDAQRMDYNAGAPLGQELTTTLLGQRERSMSIQTFQTNPDRHTSGSGNALDIASVLAAAIHLPNQTDLFEAAGFCVVDCSDVRNLTQLLETYYESRASFDLRIRYSLQVAETIGYINTLGPVPGTVTT